MARDFRHSADVYILAKKLQMQDLMKAALHSWNFQANRGIYFGHFTIPELTDLLQHICSRTSRDDTGVRVAAFRLAASYHHKYRAMAYAVSIDEQACLRRLRSTPT